MGSVVSLPGGGSGAGWMGAGTGANGVTQGCDGGREISLGAGGAGMIEEEIVLKISMAECLPVVTPVC